jgi:hypothetical protein
MSPEQQEAIDQENYNKMRKEQIESNRLTAQSLMFGTEQILEHRGHHGQEVIAVIENPNN